MKKKYLCLRNLNNDYVLIGKSKTVETNTESQEWLYEDGSVAEVEKFDLKETTLTETYYDEENNNTIILKEYRYEDEEFLDDVRDIVNSITEEPYDFVIDYLNKFKGVTVIWSQVWGTTSDYIICTDCDAKEGEYLLRKQGLSCKYTVINKGKAYCRKDYKIEN